MSAPQRLLATLAALAILLLAGCTPAVMCTMTTEVFPDYTCTRVTRMEIQANPDNPNPRSRLGDYFMFPPAELYDTYVVQQDKVLFAGAFDSFEQIPSDLVRGTPGAQARAGNLMSFRVMDMVLFVLGDFDETITDIVQSQEDGEAALTELLRLIVPELMSVLNAKYGQRYDLSRLESWLYNDLPQKLRRVYSAAWAIHSSKRSGVTSPGEDFEFYMFLRAEAKREGLELVEPGHPAMQKENVKRLKDYGLRLAQQLCPPRHGGPGVNNEMFAGVAMDELLASLQQAVTARHGSVNNYLAKIGALIPRAFGTYMTGTVMPLYMIPDVTYQYRLKIPGLVIQTNGVREFNGDLVWNFTDRDLAFTGQSLWARSIFVRDPAVYALGLRGFPASLSDVDQVFGLSINPQGMPREELLKALRDSVGARNQAPLEALAANAQSPDAQAAKGMLDLFQRHRASQSAKVSEANPPPPETAQPPPAAPAPQPAAPAPRIEAPPLP